MFIETSSPRSKNDAAVLRTCVDLKAGAFLSFYYNMYGSQINALKIEVWGTDSVWSKSGDQGQAWKNGKVDLSQYAGKHTCIEIKGVVGDGYQGDIAIDDVELYQGTGGASPPPPPPPPPSPPPSLTEQVKMVLMKHGIPPTNEELISDIVSLVEK